jgi:hypothetical protein
MESDKNVEALTTILSALKNLDVDTQKRTIQAVITFLDIPINQTAAISNKSIGNFSDYTSITSKNDSFFTENRDISPKEFLRDKSPQMDTERIACLGYYLTHYRQKPHFKTLDLSALNTEAAQPKLSNAAQAVDNATKAGLLVPAVKGLKQISATGELFVQALPDRDTARLTLKNSRVKKRTKKQSNLKDTNSK